MLRLAALPASEMNKRWPASNSVQGTAEHTGYPISYSAVARGSAPYLIADAIALAIIIVFPATALWTRSFRWSWTLPSPP